jgi:hypothetical protein
VAGEATRHIASLEETGGDVPVAGEDDLVVLVLDLDAVGRARRLDEPASRARADSYMNWTPPIEWKTGGWLGSEALKVRKPWSGWKWLVVAPLDCAALPFCVTKSGVSIGVSDEWKKSRPKPFQESHASRGIMRSMMDLLAAGMDESCSNLRMSSSSLSARASPASCRKRAPAPPFTFDHFLRLRDSSPW